MNQGSGLREKFKTEFDVSRETMDRLSVYESILRKWNKSINLVSKSTLQDLWNRHFYDSAQILALASRQSGAWVDIGSGGGFPGLVLAIIAAETTPGIKFTLVESDLRKCTFLRTVARETGVSTVVVSDRIEKIPSLDADFISARALAPLTELLGYADKHLNSDGQAIFMKGENFRKEIEEALESWTFQSEEYPSKTANAAIVLSLGGIRRV